MRIVKKQVNYEMCLVCGLKNDFGLKTSFYEMENETLVGIFHPLDEHQSYPNRMHGGMISAILDEVIGRALLIYEPDAWAVTIELNVKFRKPTPLTQKLYSVGKVTENNKRIFKGTGYLLTEDGTVLAEAKGVYFKQKLSTICQHEDLDSVGVYELVDDVTDIDIDMKDLKFN